MNTSKVAEDIKICMQRLHAICKENDLYISVITDASPYVSINAGHTGLDAVLVHRIGTHIADLDYVEFFNEVEECLKATS